MPQQIEANVTITVPAEKVIVDKSYLEDLQDSASIGKKWGIDEFRKECCGGKAREWVRLYIFAKFSKEIEVKDNHGWLIHGSRKDLIMAHKACNWIEENDYRIDWGAKMP